MSSHIAIDLGATSGRIVAATIDRGEMKTIVARRFDNHLVQLRGHCHWDLLALYREIIEGLKDLARQGFSPDTIGIDTWGVDFVCIADDGQPLAMPRAYRDPANTAAMNDYLKNVMSKERLYDTTGIQILSLNTIFQLHAMQRGGCSALKHARWLLFMPDALAYLLTGEKVCEQTIASTSQMVNAQAGQFDSEILQTLGVSKEQFGRTVSPGTVIGTLTSEVQQATGLGPVKVVAVAGHDTASAVAAVPACSERFAYLSSGTWSLMGIETPRPIVTPESRERNFTNEGGIEGTTRFLKNICGMWLYEQCRAEWSEQVRNAGHQALLQAASQEEPFRTIVNPDDDCFAAPPSMTTAILQYCERTQQPAPQTPAQFCRCIFDSLALRYRQVFGWLQDLAPFPIDTLHIIGGGSLNDYLNQATANATRTTVVAGPQECTALGNIMVQAKAIGVVADRWQMRQFIARHIETKTYQPADAEAWDNAYQKYIQTTTPSIHP